MPTNPVCGGVLFRYGIWLIAMSIFLFSSEGNPAAQAAHYRSMGIQADLSFDSAKPSQLPSDFDPQRRYTEYSYESLIDYIEGSLNITNAFEGDKVKVFASAFKGPMQSNTVGTKDVFHDRCASTECVSLQMMLLNAPAVWQAKWFPSLNLHIVLSSASVRAAVKQVVDSQCVQVICYIGVAGTLESVEGEHQPWGIANYTGRFDKSRLVYIRVDQIRDIRVWKSDRNVLSDSVLVAVKAIKDTHNALDPWLDVLK